MTGSADAAKSRTIVDLSWTNATRSDVVAAGGRLAARREIGSSAEDRIIVTEDGIASKESMIVELLAVRRA